MRGTRVFLALLLLILTVRPGSGADPLVGERAPVLRLEAGGPTARVTSLVFSADGKTLYVAGMDKVVRAWTRDARDQRFEPATAYRVPIGPGVQGALNALALSPDGKWLAAAGSGAVRLAAGFREPGLVYVPSREALSPEMWQDVGTIYVFNTQDGTVHRLRGHGGAVWTLAFAQGTTSPRLVSAGWAWDAKNGRFQAELRLWDVGGMKEIAAAPAEKLPSAETAHLLSLAAWSVGKDASQTRAAVADDEGSLRLWDAAAGSVAQAKDGQRNSAVLYLPDRSRIVTSSITQDGGAWLGNFRQWDAAAEPRQRQETNVGRGASLYWPLALAPVASRSGKESQYIAAVCLVGRQDKNEYRLCVYDLSNQQIVGERLLWDAGRDDARPVLAVGPRGRHLAVAGSTDHAVHVYALDDVIDQKRQAQRQVLHSIGATIRQAAWVKKDGTAGLLLRRTGEAVNAEAGPGAVNGDQIFEFAKAPRLANDATGWRAVARTDATDAERKRWSERYHITQVTATALLPKDTLVKNRRLMAVGYVDSGEPGLGLYDADTMDQVRELTGHLAAITSLAFSEDGKRLASAADDQTIAVWDLADVPDVLDRRGTLRGVSVVDQAAKKGLRIARVERDSAAAGKLRGGDVILGLVDKGNLQAFDNARDFYVALSERKPGTKVTLRLTGNRDVALTLDQAIDERKPLLSLFVTRDHDWIGWSPMGPYESSGLKAEGYLGWHIGTDKPDRPTAFALAKEYHKEYHQPGALLDLLETGKVAPPQILPPPKPRMTLWIGDPKAAPPEQDAQERFVLRSRSAELRLRVEDLPRELIESMMWQLDDGKSVAFGRDDGYEWTVNLSGKLDGSRRTHVVRAVLRTRGDDPQHYPAEIRFRYQPPPPRLNLLSAGGEKPKLNDGIYRVESKAVSFPLKIEAAPGPAGEKVSVRLTHQHRSKTAGEPKNWSVEKPTALEQTLTLARGLNTIEIVASNAGASANNPAERARLLLHVDFQPEPVRILLRDITPLPNGAAVRLDGTGAETVTVHHSGVRVSGVVETKGKASAEWRQGKGPPKPLPLVKGNAFTVDLDLKPGDQDFTFTATTEGANPGTVEQKIRFAPLPPEVTLTEPEAVYEGEHQGDVIVRGAVRPPDGSTGFAYTKTVLVDGKPMTGTTATVDDKAQTVEIKLPLKPGAAPSVALRLNNAWKQVTTSNNVVVRYWSPPTTIKFDAVPAKVKKPLIDLRATVHSRLPVSKIEATARPGDGQEYPIQKASVKRAAAPDTWEVSLKAVPLEKGRNIVRLWATNEQGRSRKPGEIAILHAEPVEPPVVAILGPATAEVHARSYELKYRVRSEALLQMVEVIQGKTIHATSKKLAELKPNAEKVYELNDSVKITLQPGRNHLEVVAVNEGGSRRATADISFVVVPVRIELDALLDSNGKPLALERLPNGATLVPQAPDARLSVRGRVVWDDPDDPQLKDADQAVRVFVNGFQQRPGELEAAAAGVTERRFRTELLLNRATDNLIEFELPTLKRDAENRLRVRVAKCDRFKPNQWLHLLIVGAGEKDKDRLLKGVLNAIQAKQVDGQWRTDIFDHVETYGPLTSAIHDLTPGAVRMQLARIEANMRGRGAAGAGDIVMIYFKGGEALGPKGNYLLTGDRPGKGGGSAMPCADLLRFFTASRGAHLLFLDVVRDETTVGGPDEVKQWQHDPRVARVGVFRAPSAGTARLDRALQEEMPKAARLGEVEQSLRAKYETLARQLPEQIRGLPYFYVYPALESLIINSKREK